MKKNYIYILILLSLFFLLAFIYKENLISFLISLDISNTNFLFIYIFLCIVYFITPLPITIIILLNGYLFGNYGLYISFTLVIFGSTFLYLFAKKIQSQLNLNLSEKLIVRKINLKNITVNNYSIFFFRYMIPYFIHNIYYGLIKINILKFILIVSLAEIPLTYALNSLGSSFKTFQINYTISNYSLFADINFYVPFIIILVILFLSNFFFKRK